MVMALGAAQFMERSKIENKILIHRSFPFRLELLHLFSSGSPMRTSSCSTTELAGSPWPTRARTPMDLSSSSRYIVALEVVPDVEPILFLISYSSSQVKKTSWLDGRHVVFGKVVKGMDVVRAVSC